MLVNKITQLQNINPFKMLMVTFTKIKHVTCFFYMAKFI